jgi:hypothetical protein
LLKDLPVSDPVQDAINAGVGTGDQLGDAVASDVVSLFSGTTGYLNADGTISTPATGSGDGLTSQPTVDDQWLGSTGSGAYIWKLRNWYTQTEIDDLLESYYTNDELDILFYTGSEVDLLFESYYTVAEVDQALTPSSIVGKLSGSDITPSSVSIAQSSLPQFITMAPGTGSGFFGMGAPTTGNVEYLWGLPSTPPQLGQTISFGSAIQQLYADGEAHTTYPITYINPITGGGTIEINEVASDPDPETLPQSSITTVTSNGNIFIKTGTSSYLITSTRTPDGGYPVVIGAEVNTDGDKLAVTFNQNMVEGIELGTWDVDCSVTGALSLLDPVGITNTIFTYPISSFVQIGETCDFDYTMPTDGVGAADDGAKLQSFTDKPIVNSSTYNPIAGGVDFGGNLISYWPFTSGPTDAQGNNNLIQSGALTYSSSGMQTTSNSTYAYKTDAGLVGIDFSTDFTIGFESRITSEPNDAKVFGKWDVGTNNREFDIIRESSDDSLIVSISSDGGDTNRTDLYSDPNVYPINTTIHWIISHDATSHELEVYKNGVRLISGDFPAILTYVPYASSSANLSIGGSPYGTTRPVIGYTKNAFYINKVVTPSEAAAIYNYGF